MGGKERGDGGKLGDDGFCRMGVVSINESGSKWRQKAKTYRAGSHSSSRLTPLRDREHTCPCCSKRYWRCRPPISAYTWYCISAPVGLPRCIRKAARHSLSQRGTGGGRMRRHCGICVTGCVYLARNFVVVRCETSDQPRVRTSED